MVLLQVQKWLNELCEELSERLVRDLERNKRIARTLTLHASAYKVFLSFIPLAMYYQSTRKASCLPSCNLQGTKLSLHLNIYYYIIYGTSHVMCFNPPVE